MDYLSVTARIQNQQHRRAPRTSRWRVPSDEDRFKLHCNGHTQYHTYPYSTVAPKKIPRPQRANGQNNANDAGVLTTALQYLFAPDAAPIGMVQALFLSPSSSCESNRRT